MTAVHEDTRPRAAETGTLSQATRHAGPQRRRVNWRDRLSTLGMVLPATVVFTAFLIIPVAVAIYLSLTDWNGYSANPGIIGLANYAALFSSSKVIGAALVTLMIAAVGTVGLNVIGLAFALLVNGASRVNALFRVILFYPHVLSALVVGFLWSAILGTNGVINNVVTGNGGEVLPFLSDPTWARTSMVVVLVWAGFGVNMILFLAGLQTVSSELVEAAVLDGAGPRQVFRHVTLPALAPVVTVNLVLSLVTLLKTYDLVVSLTGGGPANSTQTVAYLILWDSFHNNLLGFGSAQSVALMVVTGILALAVSRLRPSAGSGVQG